MDTKTRKKLRDEALTALKNAGPTDVAGYLALTILDSVPPLELSEELSLPDSEGDDTEGHYYVFDEARVMELIEVAKELEYDAEVKSRPKSVNPEPPQESMTFLDVTANSGAVEVNEHYATYTFGCDERNMTIRVRVKNADSNFQMMAW